MGGQAEFCRGGGLLNLIEICYSAEHVSDIVRFIVRA
jgi:hypothetical protein